MNDGFDAKIMAAILSSSRTLASAGNAAATVAGFGCWYSGRGATLSLLGLSQVCWLFEIYFSVRVAIDRDLFAAIGEDSSGDASSLDSFLFRWSLLKDFGPRSLNDRYSGALRLWKRQRQTFTAQLLTLLAALVYETVAKR